MVFATWWPKLLLQTQETDERTWEWNEGLLSCHHTQHRALFPDFMLFHECRYSIITCSKPGEVWQVVKWQINYSLLFAQTAMQVCEKNNVIVTLGLIRNSSPHFLEDIFVTISRFLRPPFRHGRIILCHVLFKEHLVTPRAPPSRLENSFNDIVNG